VVGACCQSSKVKLVNDANVGGVEGMCPQAQLEDACIRIIITAIPFATSTSLSKFQCRFEPQVSWQSKVPEALLRIISNSVILWMNKILLPNMRW